MGFIVAPHPRPGETIKGLIAPIRPGSEN